jgi:cytochrome c biogenesis protein
LSAKTEKKASEAVWEALSSLRLTIGLLIILAVVSIFGTVIPQNASPEEYLRVYKFSTYRILHILGFLDMYRSWWFVFLLALLSLNLIACSAGRFRLTWRQVFSPRARLDDPEWGSLSPRKSLSLKGPPAAWVGPVRGGLAARFSPPKVIEEEGAAHFFAEKGKFSRLGVYFVHLGVLVILGGALIGFFYGFRGGVNLLEGETAGKLTLRNGRQVPFPGFQLKLERFTVSFYPTGAPQEFRSAVTLLEEGRAVRSESIRVNHPLTHRGLTFYQASYGVANLDKAVLAVREKSTGKEQLLEVKLGARTEVPGSGYAFAVSRFFPDIQGMGPALQIVAMEPGRPEETFFVLKNHPEMEDRRSGSYGFKIREIAPRYYSGLQVNKDPGVPLVWTGCILMVFGFYLAFFVSHRRLWGRLSPRGGDTLLEMAGSGHRNRNGFEEELERLFQSFRKEILPPEGRSPEREKQA